MQAGSNLNHDIGYLDFGLTGAGELVVIEDEVISMNRRVLEGIEVSDETLGLDVIAEAGHGGDFLRARHTKKFVRGQQWKPTLLNRDTQKNWEAAGSKTATRRRTRSCSTSWPTTRPSRSSAEQKQVVDELVDAYVAAGK